MKILLCYKRFKMNTKAFLIFLFISVCAYCENTYITINPGYTEDTALLKPENCGGNGDTIIFSNGLKISSSFCSSGWLNMENPTHDGGIGLAFDTLGGRCGLKFSSLLQVVNKGQLGSYREVFFTGNPDTVWNQSTQFPDSLVGPDSIVIPLPNFQVKTGKWCYHVADDGYVSHFEYPFQRDSMGILYAKIGEAYFKIQVVGANFTNITPVSRYIGTLIIRWAVNTTGPAFPVSTIHPQNIRPGTSAIPLIYQHGSQFEITIPTSWPVGSEITISTQSGKCVLSQKSGQCQVIPKLQPGFYLVRISNASRAVSLPFVVN
jgi:hypothetical protein